MKINTIIRNLTNESNIIEYESFIFNLKIKKKGAIKAI